MIKIIINADDLGMNPTVNDCIEDALQNDYISSATIMANSDYMNDVIRITKTFAEKKSFGAHLNITEGKSMTNSRILKEAGMIDSEGFFVKSKNFKSRLTDDKIIDEVEKEWDAQLYYLLSLGIPISHIDGHHHCHTWDGYSKPLTSIMKRYKINKVRNIIFTPFKSLKEKLIQGIARATFDLNLIYFSEKVKMRRFTYPIINRQGLMRFQANTREFRKTDFFESYEKMYDSVIGQLEDVFNDKTTIELMCHPGHPKYTNEFLMIKQDVLGIKTSNSVNMINYNEL